jgi:predicted nucleotidyltransferase
MVERDLARVRRASPVAPPAAIERDSAADVGSATDLARLGRVLRLAVAAIEEAGVPYVLIGGVASSGLGRPRTTHDIDFFVKPHDAERALAALAASGFATERTDAKWIYKAFKDDIQVDIIFYTMGGIYFDREMHEHSVEGEFEGLKVRFVPPEDLLIIKAVVHDEATPRHWYDALGILAVSELDWDYLLRRSRRAQHRVLSLLLYAQSIDIAVPNRVIRSLFERIYNS